MKLILILIIIPVCEIFLFITISNYIGLFYVLFLTVLTAFLGLSLVKAHWKKNLQKYSVNSLSSLQLNFENLSDSLFILVSGIFFITPGFLTDLFGIILIHPSIRSFIKTWLVSHFIDSVEIKRGTKKPPHEYVETDYEEVKD